MSVLSMGESWRRSRARMSLCNSWSACCWLCAFPFSNFIWYLDWFTQTWTGIHHHRPAMQRRKRQELLWIPLGTQSIASIGYSVFSQSSLRSVSITKSGSVFLFSKLWLFVSKQVSILWQEGTKGKPVCHDWVTGNGEWMMEGFNIYYRERGGLFFDRQVLNGLLGVKTACEDSPKWTNDWQRKSYMAFSFLWKHSSGAIHQSLLSSIEGIIITNLHPMCGFI